MTFTDDAGQSHTIERDERYCTPPEMRWLHQTAGFAEDGLFPRAIDDDLPARGEGLPGPVRRVHERAVGRRSRTAGALPGGSCPRCVPRSGPPARYNPAT